MAINFPASPADGDVYLGYYWDDAKGAWRSQQVNSSSVITSPTTPTGATAGDLWFNNNDGTLYVYYNDGISTYWTEVKANSSLNTTLSARTTALESGVGKIVSAQVYTNSTRTVFSGSTTPVTLWSGISFSKVYASSKLIITGHIQTKGGWQYATNMRFLVGSTYFDGIGGWTDTSDAGTNQTYYARAVPINAEITGQPAGTVSVSLIKVNADAQGMPTFTFNPNATDDARYPQTRSTLTVLEVAQ